MDLQTPLSKLKGVGSNVARRLEHLELFSVLDLLYHFPFRYEDFSIITKISEAPLESQITLQGQILEVKNIYTRFGKILTQAILNDGSGSLNLTWFNQPWLTKNIQSGDNLQISGKVKKVGSKLTITSPEWEKQGSLGGIHTGRLVPVYPETSGLTSKWFRQKLSLVMPLFISEIVDPLPEKTKAGMLSLSEAIYKIHFPLSLVEAAQAKLRLSFDELFEIQLATQKIRLDWQKKQQALPIKCLDSDLKLFLENLPFELTHDQKKVLAEIIKDIAKSTPMNRLLQGEVGSGKTVVAAAAIYLGFRTGLKSLMMAPTEILAFQHYETLVKFLKPLGVKVAIYTGSKKSKESANVVVGTHAILSEKLLKENIGLVVIDEQQRFGVSQRSLLRKGDNTQGKIPHFLTMTATPIPRTVALTLYGDLDISIISGLPVGRVRIKTHVVPSYKRNDAYKFIEKKVAQGEQVYIVTPLIEESETLLSLKAAKVEYENLKKVFPALNLGLLHGRLKSKEKEVVINQFRDHKIDILVSTSVVEVGVDIPNATIMVIEGAERFGLAQLHQLRGRVGRGAKESFCLLFAGLEDHATLARLKNLEKTESGLELSEIDLKIRGSGQVFGTKQSGRWDLKIARLSDFGLIQKAKEEALQILLSDPSLDKHPLLAGKLANLTGITPD